MHWRQMLTDRITRDSVSHRLPYAVALQQNSLVNPASAVWWRLLFLANLSIIAKLCRVVFKDWFPFHKNPHSVILVELTTDSPDPSPFDF